MNHNRKTIELAIENIQAAIEMEAFIRATMDKFKHYKRVDARFIEALKATDKYHAYIQKSEWDTQLVVYPMYKTTYENRKEFRVHLSHMIEKKPLTWDKIEETLKRYNYKASLEKYENMLRNLVEETNKLKEVVDYIKTVNFECFYIGSIERDLTEMLEFALKEA